jgi:hypothetical protein
MKKIVLANLAMLLSMFAFGQIEKGRIFVGTNLGLTRQAYSPKFATEFSNVATSLFLQPSLGYLLSNKLALEIGLDYLQTWSRAFNPNLPLKAQRQTQSSFGFLLGTRYYLPTKNEKCWFSLSLGGGYRTNSDGNAPDDKIHFLRFYLRPNFNYFVSPRWALQLQFDGISFESIKIEDDFFPSRTTRFDIGLSSFNPALGIYYFIR